MKADAIVIDDDCLQLTLLVEHCHALGLRNVGNYQTAGDALLALRGSAFSTPDTLLLLDLNMPRMDGMEVLKELRLARFPGRLLFISGEGPRMLEAATRVAKGMGLAVIGGLTKPVTRDALRTAIAGSPTHGYEPPPDPRLVTVNDVRAALDRQQFEMFYQPKVVVASGAVSGFEALIRWRHPQYGLLGPDSFLEALESELLLPRVTQYLLRRVLSELPTLAAAGVRVPVAINIAISDMERPGFCNEVISALKLYKASPRDIHLEITERGVGTNALSCLTSMSRLKLHRIKLAVDDFGTGEASLLRLREYPFDYIKIDRRFVHGAATDSACRAIYDACSAMAQQLGLGVVAEGVETEEDWRFIRTRHCEQAQGYFIGHPMPLQDIRAWAIDWNRRRLGLTKMAA